MELSLRTADEVSAISVRVLGLDEDSIALDYPEAFSASLRRAAAFLCPTTPRALVDTVLEVLTPVIPQPPTRDDLMATLDQMISTGDLLELVDATSERATRLLYLGPPSFIERSPDRYLLTGIRPLGLPLVGSDITVEHEGYTRTAILDPDDAVARLRAAGLHEISQTRWIGQPSSVSATDYLAEYRTRLDVALAAGFVDGLTIIDPASRPTYYRGRWRDPAEGDSGDFVGRRPQAYGADRWCLVRLVDGAPERLIDLPVDNSVAPARDEAWRLQAAIDAARGTPLPYRTRPMPGVDPAQAVVDFFSPLPSLAERYLGLVGLAVEKSRGALFSYRLPTSALTGLASMLTETLWMTTTTDEEVQ